MTRDNINNLKEAINTHQYKDNLLLDSQFNNSINFKLIIDINIILRPKVNIPNNNTLNNHMLNIHNIPKEFSTGMDINNKW